MANIETTQTPNPVPVNTPSIVSGLNTETGPQAPSQAFGPDLNGLAQGLDSANQDIQQTLYRSRYDRRETQNAQNELWALNQHANLDKEWTGKLMMAEANGQPLNPEQFNSDFQTQVDTIASTAPNDMARASFMAKASALGLNYYKQNLGAIVRVNQQDRKVQAENVVSQFVDGARKGTVSPQDAIAGIQSVGNAVAPAVAGMPDVVSNANAQVIHPGITNIAKTQGPGPAALAVRGGYGGAAIDDTHRELLATQLDNQQAIGIEARKSIAQQNVNGLANKAAAGGFVSTQDAHAAATETANANQAIPVDTKTPMLVDFVQDRVSEMHQLASQIHGPYAEAQLRGIEQIESQNIGKVVEQRLNLMSPDEQRLGINQMAEAFGPDDPIVQHAARIATGNIEMLTPGTDKYDPASVAMKNPTVQSALASAQDALQSATTPEDQGKAQGLLKTALEQSFAAQRLVGVPEGQEQILTRQQAETYANSTKLIGDDRKLVNSLQSMYGPDYSARAVKQVFQSKGVIPGGTQMALLNPDSDKLWAAAEFQTEKLEKSDVTGQAISTALQKNPAWTDYWSSQKDDLSASQRREQMERAIPSMAQYYMSQYKMGASDAVNAVINDSVGHAYVTVPTENGNKISFPSNVIGNEQDAKTTLTKSQLAMMSLIQEHGITDTDGHGDTALLTMQAVQNGYWAYDVKNQSVTRMYNNAEGPKAVMLGNGLPLALDLKQLKSTNVVSHGLTGPGQFQSGIMGELGRDYRLGVDRVLTDTLGVATGPFGAFAPAPSTLGTDPNLLLDKPQPKPNDAPLLTAPPPKEAPPKEATIPVAPVAKPEDFDSAGLGHGDGEWYSGAKTTHFGYHDDDTPDRNSTNGIGAFGDNPLSPGAIALSPSMEKKYHALPGDVFEMYGAGGQVRFGYFADRTSQKLTDDRIDLYDPHGSSDKGQPFTAISYRKVGGGNAALKGRFLMAYGERKIAQLEAASGG